MECGVGGFVRGLPGLWGEIAEVPQACNLPRKRGQLFLRRCGMVPLGEEPKPQSAGSEQRDVVVLLAFFVWGL